MTTRAILLAVPTLLVALLAQAILWVPGHDTQGSINPSRLDAFVEASIGDARLLNPILNADTASARIADLVFDGLLRIGEDLRLEGALAHRWELSETAYLLLDPRAGEAQAVLAAVENALHVGGDGDAPVLRGLRVAPPSERDVALPPAPDGSARNLRVHLPARIEIRLARVLPDLVDRLRDRLGADYGNGVDRVAMVAGADVEVDPRTLEALIPLVEHNPEVTFWLRDDARFHDGHPVDASDVRFTYEAIMDPRNLSPRRSSFEPVARIEVLDPLRLRVVYKRLFSPAIDAWTIGILPEHLLDPSAMADEARRRGLPALRGMRDSEFNRAPIGTGAWRFVRWSTDELIELEANDAWFGGAPLYRRYFYRVLPDTLTQELEFRAGAIDTYQAEPHQAQRYRANPAVRAYSAVVPGYTYIGYNARKPPFDDPGVRRALGMAIDVDAIIRFVLFGEGERVTGPFASITPWYDRDVAALPYDPQGAERLLAERGWTRDADGWLARDGKRLEFALITNNGNLRRKAIASIVQRAWQRIGVKCNVQLFEWAVFLKDFVNPGRFDAVVLGWRLGLDPDLHQIWHSSQTDPNELNFVGFSDPRSDALIDAIREEYDPRRQRELAHALHRRIAGLQPYTFLFAPRETRLLDRRIVMVDAAGADVPVRAGGAGNLFFHMNRWRKLALDPGG